MSTKLTAEFVQREMEAFGRLEVEIKAEVGRLRDEVRGMNQDIHNALQIVAARIEESNRRSERMADKLIEMAMVRVGDSAAAVSHRRSIVPDSIPQAFNSRPNSNMWGEPIPEPEDVWPPEGFDEIPTP